jgi:ribosomal protein S8
MSKPSKKLFISYKALRLLSKKTGRSVFLISTSSGVIPHHVAIKKNLSGFILGFITI